MEPLKPAMSDECKSKVGIVYLVGAGPGDPGLITVRGRECLELADVVLYDGLANEQLLEWAPTAEKISVGKHGQTPIWLQADINRKLLELAEQGRCVVRLKGGDPAVFARTAEELEILAAAKVPFEVVPGITAALAAASYVGIPITHRQHASAVAFVTGQQQSGGTPQDMDWTAVANFPGTLVFYMGVTTVEEWTSKLMVAGKSPQTPAAIVRRCTWSDQTVTRCQLEQVAGLLSASQRVRPPVVVIVGQVAELGVDFNWFERRPLLGCGVLVTRSALQAHELTRELRALGAEVFHQPVIEVSPPGDRSSLDRSIDRLLRREVQGVTFSSSNGVDGFCQRLTQLQLDVRTLAGARLAAVGPATAARLQAYGLRADVTPDAAGDFSAQGLLHKLADSVASENWIVTTNNRSGGTLRQGLQSAGAHVCDALTYETRAVTKLASEISAAIAAQRIGFVTITSSFVAESAAQLLAGFLHQVQPLSLSSQISERLTELAWPATIQAERNTAHDLVVALTRAFEKLEE